MTISSLQQLFPKDGKYTFLVGAGCSVDPPSCLPAGRQMMEAIIKHSCAASEVEKILSIDNLRFEQLMEILQKYIDPELNILNFYNLSEKPNSQHMFLAKMITMGHFVLTTNFDCLIEYALIQLCVGKENIIPVITKDEFTKYSDPSTLFQNNQFGVYKIHGSSRNIISNVSTKESLVATIQAFGSGKEGESVFQLESFKRPLFENSTRNRTLVVMGYSGSDDFDIVPTLKLLPEIHQIVWLDYKKDIPSVEIIHINTKDQILIEEGDKVGRILEEILHMGYNTPIYRVIGNTPQILKTLHPSDSSLVTEPFNVPLNHWISTNVLHVDEYYSLVVPYEIFYNLGFIDDAERCTRALLEKALKNGSKVWEGSGRNILGSILRGMGQYEEALNHFKLAREIYNSLGNLLGESHAISHIGGVYAEQGNWQMAATHYNLALPIVKQIKNFEEQATKYSNLGMVYDHLGEWNKALDYLNQSLNISEEIGDLSGKSATLNNRASIFLSKGEIDKALSDFIESQEIAKQLGDLRGMKTAFNNIGMVYSTIGNNELALENYKHSLEIAEKVHDLNSKSTALGNIGAIHFGNDQFEIALRYFNQALEIARKIGDAHSEATALNNIGLVYREQKNNVETIKTFKEALKLFEKSKEQSGMATIYYNMGLFYDDRSNEDRALENYQKAAEIDKKIGDKVHKALCLNRMGDILFGRGDKGIATSYFQEALSIHQQLGNRAEIAKDLVNIAGVYYFVNNDLKKARKTLEESIAMFKEVGTINSKEAKDARELLSMLKLLK